MPREYHTILVRDNTLAPWEVHMGFYDFDDAVEEVNDLTQSYLKKNIKITTTDGDDQESIDIMVALHNIAWGHP